MRGAGLLDELRAAPVDALPAVLLVDLPSDSALQARVAEARALLARLPSEAGVDAPAAMLALLVSSWLGGHWGRGEARREASDRAASECAAWRAAAGTNVRPLGAVRCGDSRARALLFKLCYDEAVLEPRGPRQAHHASSAPPPCKLLRAPTGAYQCLVGGALVELYS